MKVWLVSRGGEVDRVVVFSPVAVFSDEALADEYTYTHPVDKRDGFWSVEDFDVDEAVPR